MQLIFLHNDGNVYEDGDDQTVDMVNDVSNGTNSESMSDFVT